MNCERCSHSENDHKPLDGDIPAMCWGDRDKMCICHGFLTETVTLTPKIRNLIGLPQPIYHHENWTGKGWQYKKKWNKTQSEMVRHLHLNCGLDANEIRVFLRCKHSSVRGRLSEIRNE